MKPSEFLFNAQDGDFRQRYDNQNRAPLTPLMPQIRRSFSSVPSIPPNKNKNNFGGHLEFPKVTRPFLYITESEEDDDDSDYMEDKKVVNLFEKQNKYLNEIVSGMALQNNNERKLEENRQLEERIKKLEMETVMKEQEKNLNKLVNINSSKSPKPTKTTKTTKTKRLSGKLLLITLQFLNKYLCLVIDFALHKLMNKQLFDDDDDEEEKISKESREITLPRNIKYPNNFNYNERN